MADTTSNALPLPSPISFVVCRDVYSDQRTGAFILVEPTSHIELATFPASVRVSLWIELVGAHGSYAVRVSLLDIEEAEVWGVDAPGKIEEPDPLLPHRMTFHDLLLQVPRPGRYRIAIMLNNAEFASRNLWFGMPVL